MFLDYVQLEKYRREFKTPMNYQINTHRKCRNTRLTNIYYSEISIFANLFSFSKLKVRFVNWLDLEKAFKGEI